MLTTSLQNNCSKQQQTLPGKLASVFEKDFTIDVLNLGKNLGFERQRKYNADADADVNVDADAEMPMPRFPNGHFLSLESNY